MASSNSCCCSCVLLYLVIFIAAGLIMMLDLYYCWDFPYYITELHDLLMYIFVNVFIGNIIISSFIFILLTKCKVTHNCWGAWKCFCLIFHFILGLLTVAYVYYLNRIVYRQSDRTYYKIHLEHNTISKLYWHHECYVYSLYFSLAALVIGVIPFVIFSVAYKNFRKHKGEKRESGDDVPLTSDESDPSNSAARNGKGKDKPADDDTKDTVNGNNNAQPSKPETDPINSMMLKENEKAAQKYGARFVSNVNAPLQS